MTGALDSSITCAVNVVNGETSKTGVLTTMLAPLQPTGMRILMLGQAREIRIVWRMRFGMLVIRRVQFGGLLASGFRGSAKGYWDR